MTVALIALLVVAALAAGVGAIAMRQKRAFATANEIVPGRLTAAPAAWAGAHSPEAKLHRRIGGAVAALRANPTLADAAFMESRATIEQTAVEIDERLIAAAALPSPHRTEAIALIEPEVAALEAAIASLAAPGSVPSGTAIDDSVRAAQIRLDALAEARAEIEQADPAAALHRETIDQIEAAREQPQTQPPQTQPPS